MDSSYAPDGDQPPRVGVTLPPAPLESGVMIGEVSETPEALVSATTAEGAATSAATEGGDSGEAGAD